MYGFGTVFCDGPGLKTLVVRYLPENRHFHWSAASTSSSSSTAPERPGHPDAPAAPARADAPAGVSLGAMSGIDPALRIRSVTLGVSDLDRSADFYEQALGLPLIARENGTALLGADGDSRRWCSPRSRIRRRCPRARAASTTSPGCTPPGPRWRTPLRRLAGAGWPLEGASDHGVSEAIYLSDPDGLGIEIYADRPRERWARTPAGGVEMVTLPLDLEDLLAQSGERPPGRDRARHGRRARAPEGRRRGPREPLLRRGRRLRRAGPAALGRVPRRRRLPPPHRPELVAERGRPRAPDTAPGLRRCSSS